MSLKCRNPSCQREIARIDQLAFRQDALNGGLSLTFRSSECSYSENRLPSSVSVRQNSSTHRLREVFCSNKMCYKKLGTLNAISGFDDVSVNFSAKYVNLYASRYDRTPINTTQKAKWADISMKLPQIPRDTSARFSSNKSQLVGQNTVHFHNTSDDLKQMIEAGLAVTQKSNLTPRTSQWRSFFFAGLNNTLLVLPTGLGKTLIAELLIKAYRDLNPRQFIVFIVPNKVLVDQQAKDIEKNTGLKCHRRSGEHDSVPWNPEFICVCTPAMLVQAINFNEILMSQICLLVLDEAHEAINSNSMYGEIVSKLDSATALQRPRVLGLTASPSGTNKTNIREIVESLCNKLSALPYSPDRLSDELEQEVKCKYIENVVTPFEADFEKLVFTIIQMISECDSFFETNIQKIEENESAATKIDKILKNISDAHHYSLHNNDIRLLQLCSLMKKWIDSIDLLRIFGPKRTLEDIEKDLNFMNKNENFSTRATLCQKAMKYARTELSRLVGHISHIDQESSRVSNLLSELKRYKNDDTRILIFVNRRFTAERLCRSLTDNEVTREMNPQYIIGNTAGDYPRELQQEILRKFRLGETRLLVATSVLEQGLDVASCGVVVCFDGIHSLKSIIQSRGRARQNFANFIVFVPPEKRYNVSDLVDLESTMNYAVKSLMIRFRSEFDSAMEKEIQKFLTRDLAWKDDNERQEDVEAFDEDSDSDFDEDDTALTLHFYKYNNQNGLRKILSAIKQQRPEKVKICQKQKRIITAKFNVPPNPPIPPSTPNRHHQKSLLSEVLTSLSSLSAENKVSSWIEMSSSLELTPNVSHYKFTEHFDQISSFLFEGPFTATTYGDSIWTGATSLIMQSKCIRIAFNNIHQFVLDSFNIAAIVFNESHQFSEIFFCLRKPPQYFVDETLYPFDFTNRTFNLCLKSFSPFDSMDSLRNVLSDQIIEFCHILNVTHKGNRDSRSTISETKIEDFQKFCLINEWHSAHASLLPPILPDEFVKQLLLIPSNKLLELVLLNTEPVPFEIIKLPNNMKQIFPKNSEDDDIISQLSANYFRVATVRITPSRIMFTPMAMIPQNRVFRYFPNCENFVLVDFASEYDDENPWKSDKVVDHFRMIIINGFKIAGRTYKFLGCSNSQLREGRCWFSCLDRQDVYSKIGDLSHVNNPGRKLTRLALAFSSSRETIEVDHAKYLRKVEADITIGKVLFSDGIGKGSNETFREVSKMLNLKSVPSAFQIRVGGIKGVISRYNQECDLTIRESMKKFESKHNKIEVLNVSYPTPLYLNRHVILMLSAFGVSNEIFLEMQQSELSNYSTILTSTDFTATLDFVKSRSRIVNWDRFASRRIASEPFFQQILMYQVIDLVSDLANHAKISVNKGRVLMGVLDETGILNYGEIFAHVCEDNLDFVMDGDVIVFRNPCVLPSDIRRLRARRHVPEKFKALYKNVVVFPARGPACHAHECAGGDLDGDLYYVIWDERLIPKNLVNPGREVIEVNTRELVEADVQSEQANIDMDMLNFYCNYQQQSRLGIIANAHLATSDQFGIESDEAIAIARYVVAETDAPKKGFTVGMDYANLIPKKYPHYMRKVDRDSYYSDTIVGVLFDEALSVLDIISERHMQGPPKKYIAMMATDEASVDYWYSSYCCEIHRLLKTFSLSSEADLFSGCPIWKKDFRSDFKKRARVKETLDDTMKLFWAKWSEIFDQFRTRIYDDQAKIFQWYNRPKSELSPASSFSFLALPHITTSNAKEKQTLVASVQQSTNFWISFNKLNWIDDWNRRKSVGETIFNYLNPIDCDFYGSSMLSLSEDYSDIDLFTSGDLNVVATKLWVLDTNARKYDETHTFVRVMFDSYSAEVTNFCGGSVKTYSIAKCFDENPSLWPALRVLLEWARMNKIVKSGGSQGSIMTVVGFVLLFIELSLGHQLEILGGVHQPYSFSRLRVWMEGHTDGDKSANLIVNFLQMLKDRKNFKLISSRKDPISNENLVRVELLDDLRKNAEFAFFILATHNGDIRKLFQYSTKYRMLKINNKFKKLSEASRDFENQLMKDILKKSGLKTSLSLSLKLVVKGNSYYLEITGNDHREFLKIENALKLIQEKSFAIRKYRRGDKCYHIKNSTLIIPEFSNGPYTELTFSIFQGENYHPQHSHCVRAVLDVRVETLNHQWMTTEYKRFASKFLAQIEEYKKSTSQLQKFRGTDKWRLYGEMKCVIRVGDQYFFNVQDSLINSFESLHLQRVESMISNVEICHEIEKANILSKDVRQNQSLSIFVIPSKESKLQDVSEELNLVPLQQVKSVNNENKKRRATEASEELSMNRSKKVGGLRHTFYTITATTKENVQLFANRNGFRCCRSVAADIQKKPIRVNIAAIWRSREITIATDECGIVKSIHHRKVRWMSATFKRFKKSNSDDVRTYLEAKSELDEDENCLNTLKQYLDNRSIFTTDFVKQIAQTGMSADIVFPSNPLIPEILNLNWQFYVMRIMKVDAAYANLEGDVMEFKEVYDGVFDAQGTFEWFEKHNELQIEMNMAHRSNEKLCRESYEMSRRLFDFVK